MSSGRSGGRGGGEKNRDIRYCAGPYFGAAFSHSHSHIAVAMKAAKGLIDWIKTGINEVTSAIDAEREARINAHTARVEAEVGRVKQGFVFEDAVKKFEISTGDRPVVAERVYRRFLARTWTDLSLTDREAELLNWAAGCLGIPAGKVSQLNQEAAADAFRQVLAAALVDNQINDAEAGHLAQIAARCGCTVPTMMATFFQQEGEALIRSAFTQYTSDGKLERDEWKQFLQTVEQLGVPRDKMLHAIRLPARQLIEHVLADARSDEEISEREEKVLASLLSNLIDDTAFASYVRDQIAETKWKADIAKGRLPSIDAPLEAALRAGEITHYAGPVRYVRTRELSSGTKTEELDGLAVITDTRFILSATDKSFQISHRKILGHKLSPAGLEIRSDGKGTGTYSFPADHDKAVGIWRVAIGRANQTIVETGTNNTRHISREVRQRVWQRYGGRCAECGAGEYLEFDHIVPVAKGGSNSDSNVQLLCRKCNLKKSDNI